MMWHVLAPTADGGYNSIDYRDTLDEALMALRYWQMRHQRFLRLARGASGEPLGWVVYFVDSDIRGRRDVPTGAYRTLRGARQAMRNLGRARPELREYGMMRVSLWRRSS